MKPSFFYLTALCALSLIVTAGCKKDTSNSQNNTPVTPVTPVIPVKTDVAMWLTRADRSQQFQKQNIALLFSNTTNSNNTIEVDTTTTFQTIDGFGLACIC